MIACMYHQTCYFVHQGLVCVLDYSYWAVSMVCFMVFEDMFFTQ